MRINVERGDVKEWLDLLSDAAKGKSSPRTWMRVRSLVEVPSRRRASVNIYKINRHTREGDNVVVPGKVLSSGSMDHKVNIAALEFSKGAMERLSASGCTVVGISAMLGAKRVSIII